MLGKLLLPTIEEAIHKKDFAILKDLLIELASIDIADLLLDLEEDHRSVLFRLVPKDLATEVFEFLPIKEQETILASLGKETCRQILEDMSPDDRTQLLEELPADAARRLLSLLSPEERKIATTLLGYPEESVGRLMTPDFIELSHTLTAAQALEHIRAVGLDKETIYNCYVIDNKRTLLGVVPLRNLVLADPQRPVLDIMAKKLIKIHTTADQEEAANLLKKYDLLAVPVVDAENKLVGIVTVDDVIDVIDEEATEDIHKMAAVVPVEEAYLQTRFRDLMWRRVIWLAALLFIEIIAAKVLQHYNALLTAIVALAFFLPALSATGGNTGVQSATMIIRALAIGEIHLRDFWRIVSRESLMSLAISVTLGTIIAIIVYVAFPTEVQAHPNLPFLMGIDLAVVVTVANMAGTFLPLVLRLFRLDPAVMSGPFISTLIDVACLVIYFEIARRMLHIS
jgi:magnesium transporter